MTHKPLFFESQDQFTGRYLIIDEDENSIWAYLTRPNSLEIEKDCFLGSRTKIINDDFDIKAYKDRDRPPPITREYFSENGYLPDLKASNLSVTWFEDGTVLIKINEQPFLVFFDNDKRGFSKSIAKNGSYGNAWGEAKHYAEMK